MRMAGHELLRARIPGAADRRHGPCSTSGRSISTTRWPSAWEAIEITLVERHFRREAREQRRGLRAAIQHRADELLDGQGTCRSAPRARRYPARTPPAPVPCDPGNCDRACRVRRRRARKWSRAGPNSPFSTKQGRSRANEGASSGARVAPHRRGRFSSMPWAPLPERYPLPTISRSVADRTLGLSTGLPMLLRTCF